MHGPTHPALSKVFLSNARQFLHGAAFADHQAVDISLHHMAIALELGLKSLLLDRGYGDDWNRIHIRHDLALALEHAVGAGLPPPPPALVRLVSAIGAPYGRHEFHRVRSDDVLPALLEVAQHAIAGILQDVAALHGG